MENNDQFLNETIDPEWEIPYSPEEMKRIRKQLRRHNWKIILTSVVLAAALLLGTVYVAIPFAEKQYWDPTTVSFGTNSTTDWDMTMHAYSELFCPQTSILFSFPTRTGFATYSIEVQRVNITKNSYDFSTVILEKGELTFPAGFWNTRSGSVFEKLDFSSDNQYTNLYIERLKTQLKELPDYITVSATVTFSEDLDMRRLAELDRDINNRGGTIQWAAIRHAEEITRDTTICGFHLADTGLNYDEANDYYHNFDMSSVTATQHSLEFHFKTLLRYSNDQYQAGTGIEPPQDSVVVNWEPFTVEHIDNPNYYEDALNYVEENGVYSYGCYLTASPKTLLKLLELEIVDHIDILDGWVDIP